MAELYHSINSLTGNVYQQWQLLQEVRRRQGFSVTSVSLQAKKIESNLQPPELSAVAPHSEKVRAAAGKRRNDDGVLPEGANNDDDLEGEKTTGANAHKEAGYVVWSNFYEKLHLAEGVLHLSE
ncbi:MAG: hypothetical protein ACK55I_21320, partial [bacterium]